MFKQSKKVKAFILFILAGLIVKLIILISEGEPDNNLKWKGSTQKELNQKLANRMRLLFVRADV